MAQQHLELLTGWLLARAGIAQHSAQHAGFVSCCSWPPGEKKELEMAGQRNLLRLETRAYKGRGLSDPSSLTIFYFRNSDAGSSDPMFLGELKSWAYNKVVNEDVFSHN
ncbi:hypothetical protein CIRG_03347 [Coccidioides immitis RMSCC 2394]|uniref:Uncharacterized protein n=1 Tax=Coccidioides immitis RMSCC 2394 TaxID=404692 RepID=A0A0J6Y7D3_COCIT|nr:hypothetical protein CIRG_03347 [Coccidioides immitis RMSCC 2394]